MNPNVPTTQSDAPVAVRQVAWIKRPIVKEALWFFAVAAIWVALAIRFEAMEAIFEWSAGHEQWEVDELLSVFLVASVMSTVFARRRWIEARREMHTRARAEADLHRANARMTKLFDSNPCAIVLISPVRGITLSANSEFETLTGYGSDEWSRRTLQQLGIWMNPDFHTSLVHLTKEGTRLRNVEAEVRTKDGQLRTVLVSADLVDEGAASALLLTISDITDRKKLEEQISHQALHDPLTDLANRLLFVDRVGLALARSRRMGGIPAVLYIDLDDFKSVNDTLGHDAGDQLLKDVATRLRGMVRASDACARLGGDEFAILLEDARDQETAQRIAETVLSKLRPAYTLGGQEVFVGASIGIALAEDGVSPSDLMRNADLAMYMAKSSGKHRSAMFEHSMYAAAVRRQQLDQELRGALARNEFVLDFQPIVAIETGLPISMEALTRWEHPTHGRIPPNDFIPLAEQSGAILDIGRWILTEACTACASWPLSAVDHAPLAVAVNISGRQIRETRFVEDVQGALKASGLPPERLILEITESVLVGNDDGTIKRLWEIKRMGVKLAIDDFGTGYSSLAYLQEFPVDILKIDKSFTDHLGAGAQESPLSRAVVSLGSTLNVHTVAEGVETEEQWARLRELGCGYGQGYLFTRPMPAARVVEYLEQTGVDANQPVAALTTA